LYLSPKCCWTYGGESFMGLMVKLGAACVHGTPKHKVVGKMFHKYRLAMRLVWDHEVFHDEDND
jgi:hypothetical protein